MVWRWVLVTMALGCGRVDFDTRDLHDASDSPADVPVDAEPVDPSLVAYYKLDDDPSDGVLDSSGRGHHGTCITACPAQAAGIRAGAYRFDGSTMLEVADALDLRPSTFTVTAWIQRDDVTGSTFKAIAGKRLGSMANNSWQVSVETMNELTACVSATGTSGVCDRSVAQNVSPLLWHHAALTYNGASFLLYLDGALLTGQLTSLGYDPGPMNIGGDIDNGVPTGFFQGLIDEVRVYDRALSQSEIATLMTQ